MKEGYVDTSKVSIRKISKDVAKKVIVERHYTHAWTQCKYALGVYYKEDNSDSFFDDDEKLIGVAVYGSPVGREVVKSYTLGYNQMVS